MNTAILLEKACRDIARQSGLTTVEVDSIYMGSASPDGGYSGSQSTLVLPCVIFHVTSAVPYVPRSQARRCTLRTIVRTQRDDETQEDHRLRCDEVFNLVRGSDFYAELKAYDDLTILLSVEQGETETQGERTLETVLEQTIDAVPSEIRS